MMRHVVKNTLALSLLALSLSYVVPAYAQDDEATEQTAEEMQAELDSMQRILNFIDGWEGSPEELQAEYEKLGPAELQLIEENLEFWSLEGGIGLMGGYEKPLTDGQDAGFHFRLNLSAGALWPQGDYALPIYYAITDIPGPWAIGFQVFAETDNFSAFAGGASLKWAYEYIGVTPYIEIGPAYRVASGGSGPGGKFDVGYGNILAQVFVSTEYFLVDDGLLSVTLGARVPWILFTVLDEL